MCVSLCAQRATQRILHCTALCIDICCIIYIHCSVIFGRILETNAQLRVGERKQEIALHLHRKRLPPCSSLCNPHSYGGSLSRPKFLFTSLCMYLIVLYYVLAKPILTLVTCLFVLPVTVCVGYILSPIFYVSLRSWFNHNHMCYGSEHGMQV